VFPAGPGEDLIEQRHAFSATEVGAAELAEIEIGDRARVAAGRRARERRVMAHDDLARSTEPYVELDAVGARFGGELERRHRVFRSLTAHAAMAEDERRTAALAAEARIAHRLTSITWC